MKLLDSLFPTGDKSTLELLPFVKYDDENNCFLMKNGNYMDLLAWVSKDLFAISSDDIEYDIINISKFFKTFANDVKIIGLNFPTDTKAQQAYVLHKINTTNNTVYKQHLAIKHAELEWIEKHRTDREYYLMIFSDSVANHKDNLNIITKSLGSSGLIRTMEKDKKLQILFKMNNKNTSIFI